MAPAASPAFEMPIWDLKASFSSRVSWKTKSGGNRAALRLTARLKIPTGTPYRAAKSESRITRRPRRIRIVFSTPSAGTRLVSVTAVFSGRALARLVLGQAPLDPLLHRCREGLMPLRRGLPEPRHQLRRQHEHDLDVARRFPRHPLQATGLPRKQQGCSGLEVSKNDL